MFVDIADTLNFRASAMRRHVSQPALSRAIALAEQKLGTRLFDRSTRHVALTAAGEELLPVARRIVFELRDSLGALSEFVAGRRGQFTIASLPAIAATMLTTPMRRFLDVYPNVSIGLKALSAADVLACVANGQASFGVSAPAFGSSLTDSSQFHFSPFLQDRLLLMCTAQDPLAERSRVGWDTIARRPYIANGAGSSLRPLVEGVLARRNIVVEARYESENLAVTARMVAAGLGIAVIPSMARNLVNSAGLAFLELTRPVISRDIGIVTLKRRSLSGPSALFVEQYLRSQTEPHV